ncbi:AraC family transcriptional regulator [Lapidilactobacillus bayanensis]|uniref:AraC family transcriptional regulator n=1 Tax=Lapidilactobacillus bayanensis TaxID=2485998 RepID=UPI000F78C250|nr:AraC family transcriptional regulator [Lapidilactobacillus bayanensis]
MRVVFTRIDQHLPLFIESIGYDWFQEAVVRPNGYPYYHWLQTTSGQGVITINKQNILLPTNTGLLLAPYVAHQYRAVSNEKWFTQYLTFSGQEASHLVLPTGVNYQIFNNLALDLEQAFKPTISTSSDPIELSVSLYRFLLYLKQHSQLTEHTPTANTSVINRVRQYLDTNYQQPLTNEQLANLAGFSIQHLIRLFKSMYGITPLQYLNDLRLRNAKTLLASQPQLSIDQIAIRTGFTSASYFIAQFHNNTTMTPKQFRALH